MTTMRARPSRLATGMLVGLLSLGSGVALAQEGGFDKCSHGGKQTFAMTLGSDLIGENYFANAQKSDSLHDIACRYNIGVEEMFMANDPLGIDHWSPGEGTRVMIPQRFILPDSPKAGITVNIPEMRLYFYPVQYAAPAPKKKKAPAPAAKPKPVPKLDAKGKPVLDAKGRPVMVTPPAPPPKPAPVAEPSVLGEPISKAAEVITYPISMGRMDWRTPVGKARVVNKVKDPTWTPPESIRREHAAKGDILPAVVPAGPDNPLGRFAMRLSVPGYLIHGTEENYKSFGIGMRVTHGCMRMYNEDVARLFPQVAVGTPVYLVNQPVKLGWDSGVLYMEVHQPLDEDVGIPPEKEEEDMTEAELAREQAKTPEQRKQEERWKNAKRSAYLLKVATALVEKETAKRPAAVDREAVRKAVESPTGMVVEIGRAQVPMEAAPGGYPADQGLSGSSGLEPAAPTQPGGPAGPRNGTGEYTPPPISAEPEPTRPPASSGQYSQYPYGAARQTPASSGPAESSEPPGTADPYGTAPEPEPVAEPSAPEPYYSAPEPDYSRQQSPDPWDSGSSGSGQTVPDTYEPEAPETPDPYAPDAPEPAYPTGGR
jgi:lipoprotein-anchoring transpeptidase ErfK/SrfK